MVLNNQESLQVKENTLSKAATSLKQAEVIKDNSTVTLVQSSDKVAHSA
jgi:hypothetical protein